MLGSCGEHACIIRSCINSRHWHYMNMLNKRSAASGIIKQSTYASKRSESMDSLCRLGLEMQALLARSRLPAEPSSSCFRLVAQSTAS